MRRFRTVRTCAVVTLVKTMLHCSKSDFFDELHNETYDEGHNKGQHNTPYMCTAAHVVGGNIVL
jgi:hypothetical protein